MKNKYYAVLNGQEILVRESTHNNYNYASLEVNTFGATYDTVVKRVRTEVYFSYNFNLKSFNNKGYLALWDSENKCEIKLTKEQSKAYLDEIKNKADAKFNELVSKIVKVYIKVSA